MNYIELKRAAIEALSLSGSLYQEGHYQEALAKAQEAWNLYFELQSRRLPDEDFSDLIYAARAQYEKCEQAIADAQPDDEEKTEWTIEELEEARRQQLDILSKDPGNSEAIFELVAADTMLCEAYPQDFGPQWKNAPLCREIVKYIPSIIEESEQHLQFAEYVCNRASNTLYGHPRLKLKLMELEREAIIAQGGEPAEECEMGISDLDAEIARYSLNIIRADQERLDEIEQTGHLKKDPVEWTSAFEEVIAEAEAKAAERLADTPRGMGFCFAWWHELSHILLEDYGIEWRSPAQMNPGVIFD